MKFAFLKKSNTHKTADTMRRLQHESMHPVRDWFIGLTTATLFFLGGTTLIAYDFYAQFVDQPEVVSDMVPAVTYPASEVQRFAERFAERDARFMELRAQHTNAPRMAPEPSVIPEPEEAETLAPSTTDAYTTPALSP